MCVGGAPLEDHMSIEVWLMDKSNAIYYWVTTWKMGIIW